jgi:hypothetical protein
MTQDYLTNLPAVSPQDWEAEFEVWITSFPETPLLSNEAISRESMYPDRWQLTILYQFGN